jgi:hypothetical protein
MSSLRPLSLSCVGLVCFQTAIIRADERLDFFESRIRPVLVEQCYECHNSQESAEGDLALDHREPFVKGGASGPVLDLDDPDKSLLLRVVRHEIDGVEMPEGGSKLAPSIIADLEKWIREGAVDPRSEPPSKQELLDATSWEAVREKRKRWWSFQPIRPAEPPAGSRTDIDAFIDEALTESGLVASPPASKQVLLRRAAFALTGLSPSEELAEDFYRDEAPQAFERVVDRLLDSQHYGERWARHWMDWIRYAESHGSEGDPVIENAWMYRDYLIRALNEDIPYNQLVKEHIAGDLLETPRINAALELNESLIATAHWRMVFHGFAPTDALEEKVRFTDDQIDAFSKAFLGLTVSCARCHNHKFDPISQADYYALFGILASTRPGRTVAAVESKQRTNLEQLQSLKKDIRIAISDEWLSHLKNEWPGTPSAQAESPLGKLLRIDSTNFAEAWEKTIQSQSESLARRRAFRNQQARHSWSGQGDEFEGWFRHGIGLARQAGVGDFRVAVDGDLAIETIFPSAVVSGTVSDKHAARFESPAFQLEGENDLWLLVTGDGNAGLRYVVRNYPRNGTVYPVRQLNEKQFDWRWEKFDLAYWKGDDVHIELTAAQDAPLLTRDTPRSWFGIRSAVVLPHGSQGPPPLDDECLDWIIAKQPATKGQLLTLVRERIVAAVSRWRDGESTHEDALLLEECRRIGVLPTKLQDLPEAAAMVTRYRELEAAVPIPKRVPTLSEGQAQDQALFERGDHKKPGELIPRRFLECIDPKPYETSDSGRLELASDLLRDDNPLTSRVIVNRVWHHLFGTGLVTTCDNFGRLGAEPSHPRLLDYLADEFRTTHKWSIKSLIRTIVTSDAWKRSSQIPDGAQELDPSNRLLSYVSTRRLEAEAIRDQILRASGRLSEEMFGPPDRGNSTRRSVYRAVIRNQLDPFLSTFDAPVPFASKGRRDVTNVPAQSLLMLNDPFVIQSAEMFVNQFEPNLDDRRFATEVWRRCLSRTPAESELAAATQMLQELQVGYRERLEARKTVSDSLDSVLAEEQEILEPIRKRLLGSDSRRADLQPTSLWDFSRGGNDQMGKLDLKLVGSAEIKDGALRLDGNGYASTVPLREDVVEKSFEVLLDLPDLSQRRGAAMSLQTTNGIFFDALVYAEREPRCWMSGSNNFARTEDFGGPQETSQNSRIHLVVTYREDGTIACYRNGVLYGKPYQTGVQKFKAGESQFLIGLRHGTGVSPGRMLTGSIFEARFYSRALTANEVQQAASAVGIISEANLLATATPSERQRLVDLRERKTSLRAELEGLGPTLSEDQARVDLVHAVFNLKEFIYVR